MHKRFTEFSRAFTIVELLVIIVIIGILATITVVSYTGISNKAIIASMQSDLDNSSKQLKLFQIENSAYPTSITDCPTPASGNLCVKPSGSNTIASYVKDNSISPQGFCINLINGTKSYKITSTTYNVPTVGDCSTPTPVATIYTSTGTYPVPAATTSIQLEAWGSVGATGGSFSIYSGGAGGNGGYAKGNLSVVSGTTVYINIGVGAGSGLYTNSGWGTGGNGGGASDVRYGSNALSDRKIVAGGGGGGSSGWDNFVDDGGNGDPGGAGGGTSGGSGTGGIGGTQSSGGASGTGDSAFNGGGGGGGGYYGGRSGSAGSGGGGSGYIGGVTSGIISSGIWSSAGKVVITTVPPPIF